MGPLVVIVVLNWNGSEDTRACLESLRIIQNPNFKVLVVDNGSTDDSVSRLRSVRTPYSLELLETGRNLGYAGGNNVGIKRAMELGAEFVLVLNNDTTVAPDLLGRLVESARRNPRVGIFSARVLYADAPESVWFDGARWNGQKLRLEFPGKGKPETSLSSEDHPTDYASGAALFFRAELAREIGLLDESFFLVWEEVDWCFRARKAGWTCMVVPGAKVWHKIGVSFGSEASPLRTYFSTRNQLLWFSRHASAPQRVRLWLKTLVRVMPRFVIANSQGALSKRLVWGLKDYVAAWRGRSSRYEYLAVRRAVLDYVFKRLGDCPPVVREWSRAWTNAQTPVSASAE